MDLVFLNMLDLFIVKFLLFKSSFWKWYKTTFFFSTEDVLVESHGFKSIVVIKKLNNLKAQKKWLFFSLCNPYSKGRTLKKFFFLLTIWWRWKEKKPQELSTTRTNISVRQHGLILHFLVEELVIQRLGWHSFTWCPELHLKVSHEETNILSHLEQFFVCLKEIVLFKISLLFKIFISTIRLEC